MAGRSAATNIWRDGLDFPGFAQEFLRRNPAYRADYLRSVSPPLAGAPPEEGMARRWGLTFPGRSFAHRCRGTGALGGIPLPLRRRARCSAVWVGDRLES